MKMRCKEHRQMPSFPSPYKRNLNPKNLIPKLGIQETLTIWMNSGLRTWCKELTHLKRPWCWQRLKAGGEWEDRGWDGWMASPTLQTWVWVSSRSWWCTGKPGMLQSIWLQSQTWLSDWTELNNESVDCFGLYNHFHSIDSSSLRTWYISPSVWFHSSMKEMIRVWKWKGRKGCHSSSVGPQGLKNSCPHSWNHLMETPNLN